MRMVYCTVIYCGEDTVYSDAIQARKEIGKNYARFNKTCFLSGCSTDQN
jgi:hypothetical protein